ncbi:MAG TPA: SPW repeat protein [Myxococcales bacterium]|nr:SPW repeat protein [Myxococcales bacterium]
MAARTLNILVGVWLFISTFCWAHSQAQMTNTWILGVLCVVFALVAMRTEWMRYLNTALATWLFISAFVLPSTSRGTVWNNALVAVAIFVISLAPSDRLLIPQKTAHHTA